jgi:hypothetical protein
MNALATDTIPDVIMIRPASARADPGEDHVAWNLEETVADEEQPGTNAERRRDSFKSALICSAANPTLKRWM